MTAATSKESGTPKACSLKVGLFHTAFIGDLALAGVLIEGLHAAGHTIALVSNGAGAALYAHDRRLSECVVVKKGKGLRKLLALLHCARVVKALELDVLLVPHRSLTSSLVAKLSGVKRTIGFASATGACLYAETKPYLLENHESERLLGLAPDDLVPCALRERIRQRGNLLAEKRPDAFFESFPHLENENVPFFVVSPGSVWKTKQYPAAAFAQACRLLLERHSTLECVLAGGPSDTEARDAFLDAAKLWNKDLQKRLHDATHCIPLADLPLVLGRATLSLANDSAPFHIACGVNTPVVGIFGPTSATSGFGPQGSRALAVTLATEKGKPLPCQPCSKHGAKQCPLGHWRCMKELSAHTVASGAESLLV